MKSEKLTNSVKRGLTNLVWENKKDTVASSLYRGIRYTEVRYNEDLL